jgi:hypothetical protein
MVDRNDPSNCVRYILSEDFDTASQKLISWLGDGYTDIYLIQRESCTNRDRVLTRLTLFHRHWGPTVTIQILPTDPNQTLILISLPPDPDLEEVSFYEDRILEYLPDSSASIRLARVDGNDARVLSLICTALRGQRHHCWMQILSGLIQSLQLELFEGDPDELVRDIPTDNRDIGQLGFHPSQDESLVLDLWGKGYTAKQIALRTGRTEKTILNRLTMMRKTYGEQLVPRRRIA